MSCGCEDSAILWEFFTNYLSICKGHLRPPPPIITKLYSVKNGNIFKTSTQKKNFNTVHNLIYFYMVFTNKNIITKVYLPLIITEVKNLLSSFEFSYCKYRKG